MKGDPYQHEIDRINQFKQEANGDEQKFRQKLLVRASRCSVEKLERFVWALQRMGLPEVAAWVKLMLSNAQDKAVM